MAWLWRLEATFAAPAGLIWKHLMYEVGGAGFFGRRYGRITVGDTTVKRGMARGRG